MSRARNWLPRIPPGREARPARSIAALACALLMTIQTAGAAEVTGREQRLQDLAALRSDYVLRSHAFTPEARATALEVISQLERQAGSTPPAQFLLAIARITALADNGHDSWYPDEGAWLPPRRAPLHFVWFPDALVIARTAPEYAELLGARVTRIDGHPADEVFQRLRELSGGPDNYRRWGLSWALERAELLHAMGLTAMPDEMRLTLMLQDGREQSRAIPMISAEHVPHSMPPARLLSRPPYGNERELGWTAPPGGKPDPPYLQEPDRLFRIVHLPVLNALYLQLRAHSGSDEERIEDFISEGRDRLQKLHPEHLIVDLRFDGGGNIDPTVAFFRELPAMVPGRVYIVVSRYTFSAGIVAAALLRKAAGARARIVGEPVGDRLRWWSEGSTVCLPNSRYCLQARDGLWDLERGCGQEPGCYGDAYDAKVGSLDPDLAAPLTADAWLDQADPAMSTIETNLWSCKACEPGP